MAKIVYKINTYNFFFLKMKWGHFWYLAHFLILLFEWATAWKRWAWGSESVIKRAIDNIFFRIVESVYLYMIFDRWSHDLIGILFGSIYHQIMHISYPTNTGLYLPVLKPLLVYTIRLCSYHTIPIQGSTYLSWNLS